MAQLLRTRSRGAAEVEATWNRFVPSARLDPPRSGAVAFDWTSLALPGLSVLAYDLAGSVRAGNRPENQIIACRVASPRAWVGNDQGDLDASAPWMTTPAGIDSRWEGRARVRAFVFDQDVAERTARQISGDDGLRLRAHGSAPLTTAAGKQWERAFGYVLESLLQLAESDEPAPVMAAEVQRHALAATLAAFPTTFHDAARRSAQTGAAPAAVRRAMSYMQEHAGEPITIDEVAVAARMSTRGLQYAFRRALEMSPTEYLRGLRLAGAHEELERLDTPAVAAVARRWGFASASRFAAHYRARYGRTPAQTARSF